MLPDDIIAVIFTKLLLTYGRRFSDAYAGQDLEVVRRHWQHELGAMPEWAVHYALEHLPADWPPNVLQFRVTCNSAPPPMRSALPPPRTAQMTPRVKARLSELLERIKGKPHDPLAGARNLRDRERRGFHLTKVQREFWRQALHHEQEAEARQRTQDEDVQ